MYEKDYQDSPIDTSQEYNVELKRYSKSDYNSLKVLIILVVVLNSFFALNSSLKDIVYFMLYSGFLVFLLYLSYKSYKSDIKTYFIISKEGIDFCEASLYRGNTQRQMSWSEIEHIEIFPVYATRPIRFWYNMKVFDTFNGPCIKVYTFSLGRNMLPEKMVKVLKAYSSDNVKIKVKKTKIFGTKTEWY